MPKRKREPDLEVSKCTFIPEDSDKRPTCPHGAQILFERSGKRFYACSAFRSRKECQRNSERIGNKQSNSGLAQYLFDPDTTEFFVQLVKSLNTRFVLCLGVPSVHEKLLKIRDVRTLLLDIDPDMVSRYEGSACHYNMCNHHFFSTRSLYNEFLKQAQDLLIIMDPPFGVKPEVLAHVHTRIEKDFHQLQSSTLSHCHLFWIAPYFLEGHIRKANSTLQMSDFQVNYLNHTSFSKGKTQSRKHGSPIRFFTNLDLSLIKLPERFYKFCQACNKYVAKSNRHCDPCGACTSKDGQTYHHCSKCNRCVKPTWSHCAKCKRCLLTADHVCQR